ncbi:ABC transporter substrate-binding protein [Alsobacter sp. KACC 23698]|uniref:ABC transporter substrate-binding protein n=1 Tax=Alsobacter sp. KACC 23698 TaxID=3149229 RepID=A0AAU7JK93_9HYPH
MTTDTTRRDLLKWTGAGAAALAAGGIPEAALAKPPFFKLYLMIFNNLQSRMIWTDLIGKQFARLGIDVVSSYQPPSVVIARRANDTGKTHVDGGWDMYSERIYYSGLVPLPETLFHSKNVPPNGQNFYRISDKKIDESIEKYSRAVSPEERKAAIHAFIERWYEIEPLHIVFYPEEVIITNPKLKGMDSTTYNPVFFPRPENWTIEGATGDVTATFASWQPPSQLIPMYGSGYNEANIFGPVYNALFEYDSWANKKLVPALAESVKTSDDGKTWVFTLRKGVKWHSGEEFTAEDVKFTWDTVIDKAYGSVFQAPLATVMGGKDAYKVTGAHEITVQLPEPNIMFQDFVLPVIAIMPKHAYQGLKPEELRGHVISTWVGTFPVKTSDGKVFEAKGGVGTGPWIPQGFDPSRKAYRYVKNENYWKKTTGNVKTFYVVNIQGADAVLSAIKSGDIDAHDPMYDVGGLLDTIDPSWGTVNRFDSFKWMQTCLNMNHPVFGTGVETPLGKQDPSRAAEAAAYVRKAMSHMIPREQIIKNVVSGFGKPGTVPIPFTSEDYDHDLLKPIAYDFELAKKYMEKAGYKY